MQVAIQLRAGSYQCLLNHVPKEESDIYRTLKEAMKRGDPTQPQTVFTMTCGPDHARLLLELAKRHCPQAVQEIELAIRVSSAQPT